MKAMTPASSYRLLAPLATIPACQEKNGDADWFPAVDILEDADELAQVCRQRLNTDPITGALFVFANRRRRALKILVYDGQGFWLCQKRLSQGRFDWWPSGGQQPTLGLDVHQLQLLIWNGNPNYAQAAPMWRPIAPAA